MTFAGLTYSYSAELTSEDLNRHVNNLPQELRDEIYDLVFTAEPGVREVDELYRTPRLLHVSRASRAKFSTSYYCGTGVTFLDNYRERFWDRHVDDMTLWARFRLQYLESQHWRGSVGLLKRYAGLAMGNFTGYESYSRAHVRAEILEAMLNRDERMTGTICAVEESPGREGVHACSDVVYYPTAGSWKEALEQVKDGEMAYVRVGGPI